MSQLLQELQDRFEEEVMIYTHSLPNNNLHLPVKYILGLGGKRIRPVLVLLAGSAFGCDLRRLFPAALAVEIFHNFSLVHDDIMDRAPLRRGKVTVHEKWNENAAILSGDAMLIEAYKQLTLAGGDKLVELLELFNTTSMEVCEGQQLDMDFEKRREVGVGEYIEMISLKTAVLLGCALKMGAILGGASAADAQRIYNFGKLAGIGFQIQDDYLDAFGDPESFGKQVGGDIISNKKTYLIIQALQTTSPEIRDELAGIYYNNSISEGAQKVKRVKNLFGQIGVDRQTLDASRSYFDQAMEELVDIDLPEEKKAGFLDFLDLLQGRRK